MYEKNERIQGIESYETHVQREISKLKDKLKYYVLTTEEQLAIRRKIDWWLEELDNADDEE